MRRFWTGCIGAWHGGRVVPVQYRPGNTAAGLCVRQGPVLNAILGRMTLAGALLVPHSLYRWAGSAQEGAAGSEGLIGFFTILVTALLTCALVETVFAAGRGTRILPGWFLPGWLFALVAPAGVSWPEAAFAMALGTLVGRLLFGGPGKQIVSPALLALIVLYSAYPGAFETGDGASSAWLEWSEVETGTGALWSVLMGFDATPSAVTSPLGCLVAAIYLALTSVVSWRTLAGGLLGIALASTLMSWGDMPGQSVSIAWWTHLVSGGFAFGLVFLAADPGNAPLTTGGRWSLGLMSGVLVVLIRMLVPGHPDGVLHAILLAALFAPLADEWFVYRAVQSRRRREEAWP